MLDSSYGSRPLPRPAVRTNGPDQAGFTLIELLIVVAIISVVAALATAGLLRARITANETSAIATMRVTLTSQKTYQASCGRGGYATSYLVLGTPMGPGSAFISADLGSVAAPQKSGYNFNMGAGAGAAPGPLDCGGLPTISSFYANGMPMSPSTGTRRFAVNASGQIWQTMGGGAPAEPFGPPATPIQ
jgi:prepilin-type N-terminal cleavage/methylation domain-containing protein